MLLSSRSSPPKPLKFGGPDRFLTIKNLFPTTPIPSPSLPSILPRHGKKPPKINSRKIVRALIWLAVIIGAYYLVSFGKRKSPRLAELTFLTSLGKTYEIVEAFELPDHPTPLALTDRKGNHHWTISIPSNLRFPLPATDYADICSQVEDVARHVAGGRKGDKERGYYEDDPNYIDVEEAQARHFLPREEESPFTDNGLPICHKSLTYVLDAADAGLGSAFLGVWLSYSLAKHENRAFFLDDTKFPYGNYSKFFASPPPPNCRLPPSTHRVPCPRQAKHLVVSAATTGWVFGEAFHQHFGLREIFDMTRNGYEALFTLQREDAEYVRNRNEKLRAGNSTGDGGEGDSDFYGLVGIHIRRGDRHPYEWAYERGYLPPDTYMAAAQKLIGQTEQWKFLLASDDADMYDHISLSGTIRAQERISLASKKKMSGGGLGWEGGFFKDVFWGLGLPAHVKELKRVGSPAPTKAKKKLWGAPDDDGKKSPKAKDKEMNKGKDSHKPKSAMSKLDGSGERDYRTNPTQEALQLRQLLGRAYLLDLAMLAHSDKVVCGVSSNACRILAVMMGWERAFVKQDWINVDGSYGWRVLDY